eukprot:CAMPEP_0194409342 /NCGR_PEP_ID=MMETSP0176-20130528/7217_1 /TAXON_ID=216777 /ORGANISM="Proboscia alata, Strain PI-D3" /LENGTH=78 /DNA_ID=CAMNT_0039209905 /DNA_START=137 /DNA_END=370 /DNA_ORIENTATION=-
MPKVMTAIVLREKLDAADVLPSDGAAVVLPSDGVADGTLVPPSDGAADGTPVPPSGGAVDGTPFDVPPSISTSIVQDW